VVKLKNQGQRKNKERSPKNCEGKGDVRKKSATLKDGVWSSELREKYMLIQKEDGCGGSFPLIGTYSGRTTFTGPNENRDNRTSRRLQESIAADQEDVSCGERLDADGE